MTKEAKLVQAEGGLEPEGPGWFALNVRDACWYAHDAFGSACRFEGAGEAHFGELGINVRVLEPGQPNCRYHAESLQEDFLVLSGECLVLVEGEQRRLRAWDIVHCPPWTEHVFVGAGDRSCVILMVGARSPEKKLRYPVSELALSQFAGVEEETDDPVVAYADVPARTRTVAPTDGLPWGT
jgi:uncharacterized cupin superfamily protein